ncbi:MAG: NAD+ synthase [Planctomycetota bacterium]|jgi:NAD+ synthase|nr:NAD+ synthase [Planctomycetota bacterium]
MSAANPRIVAAQLNTRVGDIAANVDKIRQTYLEADADGADLLVTPELSVTGYPLEDMANIPDVLDAAAAGLESLRLTTRRRRAALMVGAPVADSDGFHNAAAVFQAGSLLQLVRKRCLPNYGVFDEKRNFRPETGPSRPFALAGRRIGALICEDLWFPETASELRAAGAELLVSISASPFRRGIQKTRVIAVAAKRVEETGLPLLYVNSVGGQDELVFDGGSFFMDAAGRRRLELPMWEECAAACEPWGGPAAEVDGFADDLECVWRAMLLSIRDYVAKSGFTDVVLGLSGGIDSAVVAAAAGDALGPGRVHCVRLPSVHTAELSNTAAGEMCRRWGFDMLTLPIGVVVAAAAAALAPLSPNGLKKLTSENLQARARGYLLMTLSNDRGWLLLSTGNKSELAVGYATLYGDMCGGFNPLKDVFKTTVYELARWRNRGRAAGLLGPAGTAIPAEIIAREPSAELAPGQKDSDSLPPYPELDAILAELVEKWTPVEDIVAQGFARETVLRVFHLLRRAEYKRRQGAPGPKTTMRAFTRDRRVPMVNGFDPGMAGQLRSAAERMFP